MELFGIIFFCTLFYVMFGMLTMMGAQLALMSQNKDDLDGREMTLIVIFWPLFVVKAVVWLVTWPVRKAHSLAGSVPGMLANWWKVPLAVFKGFKDTGRLLVGKR